MHIRLIIEGILTFCTLSAILLLGISGMTKISITAVNNEARESLELTAKAIAATIDVRTHETFISQSQSTSKKFKDAEANLAKIVESDKRFDTIYTVRWELGKSHFVLDPKPSPGSLPEGTVVIAPSLMEYYPSPPLELREAIQLNKTMSTSKPYIDEWGVFMTAYAPLVLDNVVVGVLAIDIDAKSWDDKFTTIRDEQERASWLSILLVFCISVIQMLLRFASKAIQEKKKEIIYGKRR